MLPAVDVKPKRLNSCNHSCDAKPSNNAEHMANHETTLEMQEGAEPPSTEAALEEVLDVSTQLLAEGQTLLESLLRTWNLYQIGIALGLFALAHIMRAILGPRVRAWMAARENWPKWRMRILVVIHQRLRAIFFVGLIWATIYIMRGYSLVCLSLSWRQSFTNLCVT